MDLTFYFNHQETHPKGSSRHWSLVHRLQPDLRLLRHDQLRPSGHGQGPPVICSGRVIHKLGSCVRRHRAHLPLYPV